MRNILAARRYVSKDMFDIANSVFKNEGCSEALQEKWL